MREYITLVQGMMRLHEELSSCGKTRAFIIGARGFLGRRAARAMSADFDVIRGVRTRNKNAAADEVEIDITRPASVEKAFKEVQPDVVLLLAAMSDIDQCERTPEEAVAINVRGAEHVVHACRRSNARLIFTSSGAVFDGYKHGYDEEDEPSPISVYGKTKAQGEAIVSGLGSRAIIVRIALALGFAGEAGTNALLDSMAQRLAAGETVALPTFEYRNPIDAGTLSWLFIEVLKWPKVHGIFHVGAQESISRYDLGLKLAARMGYAGLVQPQSELAKNGRAPRGHDLFLLTDKIARILNTAVPTCDQVIERCFDGLA
jgi:dTDP-4-dehydrorhamnose reductase